MHLFNGRLDFIYHFCLNEITSLIRPIKNPLAEAGLVTSARLTRRTPSGCVNPAP